MDYYKKPLYKFCLLAVLLVVTSIVTYLYWIKYNQPIYGIDDANIYLIYMRNLAHGNGFVYNAGGEHVEGFTSMLWVLIGAIFYLFTTKPEMPLFFLNIVLVTLTIWRICLFADRYFADKRIISPYSIIITGFILLIPGYVEWTTFTLMETGLWSLLLVLLFVEILDQYIQRKKNFLTTHVFLVLLLFTRPESYLWGGFAIFVQFVLHYIQFDKNFIKALRPMFVSISVFVLTILTLTVFRLVYFGYPFPNTYYAKISIDRYANYLEGIKYIQAYFYYYTPHIQMPIICLVISIIAFILKKRNAIILGVFPFIILLVYLTPLYTGGDHFALFRFIQPFIPLFVLFYVLSFFTLFQLKKWYWYPLVFISLIFIFYSGRINFYNVIKQKRTITAEFRIAAVERMYAEQLNQFFQYQHPYPTYGVIVAGGSAYVYKGKTIDLLGLNNVQMAHSSRIKTGFKNHDSFSKQVFYEQKPDLFFNTRVYRDSSEYDVYKNINGIENEAWNRDVYKNILLEERFKTMYYPVFIFSKKDSRVVQTYTHQDFLEKLDTTVYWYFKIPIQR